jgi:hypothetical protein
MSRTAQAFPSSQAPALRKSDQLPCRRQLQVVRGMQDVGRRIAHDRINQSHLLVGESAMIAADLSEVEATTSTVEFFQAVTPVHGDESRAGGLH